MLYTWRENRGLDVWVTSLRMHLAEIKIDNIILKVKLDLSKN